MITLRGFRTAIALRSEEVNTLKHYMNLHKVQCSHRGAVLLSSPLTYDSKSSGWMAPSDVTTPYCRKSKEMERATNHTIAISSNENHNVTCHWFVYFKLPVNTCLHSLSGLKHSVCAYCIHCMHTLSFSPEAMTVCHSTHYLLTEPVDGLWRKTSPSESSQGEQPWVIPATAVGEHCSSQRATYSHIVCFSLCT